MKETASQEVQAIGSEPIHRAVLVLPSPPAPYPLGDWYERPITGVPFLLLNLLNLQKGGFGQITLYHPDSEAVGKEQLFELLKDTRLHIEVNWVFGLEQLEPQIQPDLHFLDGSTLFDKNTVRGLLSPENNGSPDDYIEMKVPESRIRDYLASPGAGITGDIPASECLFCWWTAGKPGNY